MGVSITQEPTSPNVAYTKLMYVVSGSGTTSNPQYKYVCDIFESGSPTRFNRIKTIPNPQGVGVFDISSIIQNRLSFDNNWEVEATTNTTSSAKSYIVKFGEEYGTSPSSSITVYNGEGSPGDPNVSGSDLFIFKGTIDSDEINSYNFNNITFDTGSFTSKNFNNINSTYDNLRGPRLSNYPKGYQNYTSSVTFGKPISLNDYETISFERILKPSNYIYYTSSLDVYNTDGGLFNTVLDSTFSSTQNIITLGVGPQNLIPVSTAISSSFTGSWAAYKINLLYQLGGNFISQSYWYYNDNFDLESVSQVYYPPVPQLPGVWSTGPSLYRAKAGGDSSGDTTNGALVYGGNQYNITATNQVSEFDPITNLWESGTTLTDNDTLGITGGGSFTDTLAIGGDVTSGTSHVNTVRKYNGTSWSNETVYPLQIAYAMSAITSETNALVFGGEFWTGATFNRTNTSYSYNGTSWSSGGNLLSYRYQGIGIGTPTNALVIGGLTASSAGGSLTLTSNTEVYNGSVWSTNTAYPYAVQNLAAAGNADDALVFGGRNSSTPTNYLQGQKWTFSYNGTSFTTRQDLPTGLTYHMGGGDSNNAFAVGGGFRDGGNVEPISSSFTSAIGLSTSDGPSFTWDGSTPNPDIPPYIDYIFGGNLLKGEAANDCFDGATRFAFINQYGTWDYYSIYNPERKSTNITRKTVRLSQADYSSTTSVYNISNRSNTQYYASLNDRYQITTDYIDQGTADWLTELLESPSVYIQDESRFIPIVITNAEYTWKTNPRGQKVFQYLIEYVYSNQRRARI